MYTGRALSCAVKHLSLKVVASIFVTAILAVACLVFAVARSTSIVSERHNAVNTRRANEEKRIILWAWERPTDLHFIDPRQIGVAFLAKSIRLQSDQVVVRPRLQSLNLPEGAQVIAVARIETARERPSLSANQREMTARTIADMASQPNVREIQIDFDATRSEREFYRQLIVDVRKRLPATTRLSITALASWCMSDDWLSDLPIDEAVPMLFRMAADGKQIVNRLNSGDDFAEPLCRQSYGLSLDEQRPTRFPSRSLYIFNPDAWTEQSVHELLESIK